VKDTHMIVCMGTAVLKETKPTDSELEELTCLDMVDFRDIQNPLVVDEEYVGGSEPVAKNV
jgi:hypothetical protein